MKRVILDIWALPHHKGQKAIEARTLTRILRPFKDLRTLYLRINLSAPGQLCLLDRLLPGLAKRIKFEADEVFSKDCVASEERPREGRKRRRLRIRFYSIGKLPFPGL